ncbi:MAG: sigma-70 family RNA polymerase sigma factor [Archangiaceae bacterium]|nr:sigma-70 family RNA polymerase sigma factor [Archangiaceae bacterium]
MHDDDARLVTALLAGDEAAFTTLSLSVQRPLSGLVRRLVSEAAVEDVVQQTWLTVLSSLARFEGRSRLSTWVLQIGLNLARAVNRSAGREEPLSDDEAPAEERFTAVGRWSQPVREWVVSTDDPERAASNRQLLTALDRALQELPEKQRVAVTLCDVEGLLPREAAEVLGVEDGSLRVVLHRGRTKLRESLERSLGRV